ncbi:uncharacterized protein LOC120089076 [Benincasa hispida]|uniref:uncharacterized protein LOC120089076 n=1 Tax=Benincasa hispida TaxID=102211 RepID=UPI0018FFE67E|nr:uncharacterized protein LOC120089076 [Benincasa hispida]
MEPQIGTPLLYVAITRDIWEAVKKLYCTQQNGARLYALRKQVHECKQGTIDVTTYFNKLFLIWQEMDLCQELIWSCPCGGVLHYQFEETNRFYGFLARLNPKFDAVRSRIMGARPVPSLMEVCSGIRLEEDRSNAMNNPVIQLTNFAAFKVSRTDKQNGKVLPACEHCKKP